MRTDELSVYLDEIGFQARCAFRASQSLSRALYNLDHAPPKPGVHVPLLEEVFRALHSVLTHASCISKLLWPVPPKAKGGSESKLEAARRRQFALDRGAELRTLLRISESSVLKSRVVRDHLEHFDERLDRRILEEKESWIINNIGALEAVDFDRRSLLRWLDPHTGELFIQGDSVVLPVLLSEIDLLFQVLPEESRR